MTTTPSMVGQTIQLLAADSLGNNFEFHLHFQINGLEDCQFDNSL